MRNLCALVAAGGHGLRMSLSQPKATLEFAGQSMAWWTVRSLLAAGIGRVQVYVDDTNWAAKIRAQLACFPHVSVFEDTGYASTFLLFKEKRDRYADCIFTYGHAPRCPFEYSRLAALDAPIVASVVTASSMRRLSRTQNGELLEPPLLVRRATGIAHGVKNWAEFFAINADSIAVSGLLEIGEYNSVSEWQQYQAYMPKVRRGIELAD